MIFKVGTKIVARVDITHFDEIVEAGEVLEVVDVVVTVEATIDGPRTTVELGLSDKFGTNISYHGQDVLFSIEDTLEAIHNGKLEVVAN